MTEMRATDVGGTAQTKHLEVHERRSGRRASEAELGQGTRMVRERDATVSVDPCTESGRGGPPPGRKPTTPDDSER